MSSLLFSTKRGRLANCPIPMLLASSQYNTKSKNQKRFYFRRKAFRCLCRSDSAPLLLSPSSNGHSVILTLSRCVVESDLKAAVRVSRGTMMLDAEWGKMISLSCVREGWARKAVEVGSKRN